MQSTVLVSPVVRLFAQALLTVLAACCLFAFAAPRAQAASLTEPQIQAILGLLSSFGADQATITNTEAALRGREVEDTSTSSTGTLAVSTDASSPAYKIVAGGSTGVTVGVYRLRASGEAVNFSKITVKLTNGSPSDVGQVYFYYGPQLLGTAVFTGTNPEATATLSQPLLVHRDTDAVIMVKTDLASIGVGQSGTSGSLVQVDFVAGAGTGASSGLTVPATGNTSVAGARIFKSYPTVTFEPLPSTGLADGRLLRFKITANSSGDVGLGAFNFSLNQSNVNVSAVSLYMFRDSAFSQPACCGVGGRFGEITGSGNRISAVAYSPEEIPAGESRYFELRGTVSSLNIQSSVVTTLLGDATYEGVGQFNRQIEKGYFTWSPNSTSTSFSATNDWTNGYGVPGLAGGAITQIRTGGDAKIVDCAPGYHSYNDQCVSDTATGITLAAPNGGEKWELGVTNSVTWKPYGYNPDINPAKDVTAYLEKKNGNTFTTLGRVEESGKASIHWVTGDLNSALFSQTGTFSQAPTGEYYIRVVNNVTGASDRSDKPFKITARPVELKVNGSDGPVKLANNQKITVKWSSTGGRTICSLLGVRETPDGNNYIGNLPSSGTRSVYAAVYADISSNTIAVKCHKGEADANNGVYDVVAVNALSGSEAALQVLTPNGGEQIMLNLEQGLSVVYALSGLSKVSVALYKNDQWFKWLSKDEPASEGKAGLNVGISSAEIGRAEIGQSIFKIYVTGKKADGSGYIDDKSDAAFSFVASPTPVPACTADQVLTDGVCTTPTPTPIPPTPTPTPTPTPATAPTCVLKTDKTSYYYNDPVKLSWSSKNATSAQWVSDTSGKDNVTPPAGVPATQGSGIVTANVSGNPYLTLSVSGSGGTATCSATFAVASPVTSSTKAVEHRGKNGSKFTYQCPAAATQGGVVWGSNPYTDDSSVCTAARHAGAIDKTGGLVTITISGGKSSYTGSTSNGVTSQKWDRFDGSFTVESASVDDASQSNNKDYAGMMASVALAPFNILVGVFTDFFMVMGVGK